MPGEIKYTKSSGGHFSIYYDDNSSGCYVGKVEITELIKKISLIKEGNTRVTKVFTSLNEANNYINRHPNFKYQIKNISTQKDSFIQYLTDLDSPAKYIYSNNLQTLILYIPFWIKYIKKCRRDF